MLRFTVIQNGRTVGGVNLAGAHVMGTDGVPLRAEVEYRNSQLICVKRSDGPASVALLWPVAACGAFMLESSRLMDRDRPYLLSLELARGRLMRINQKREEWGLFDYEGIEPLTAEIDRARDLLVEALKADTLAEQAKIADRSLQIAMVAGEKLSRFHAELLLTRRKQTHGFSRRSIGCTVDPTASGEAHYKWLRGTFDYIYLSIPWRAVEPRHQEYDWQPFDSWVEWLAKHRLPIKVGPLLSFHAAHVPDWLIGQETDFETIRNLIFDHVRRVVERYGNYVHHWGVVSGIHAENVFDLSFEQIMDLTRVTVMLAKQLAPRAQAVVDLTMPWGEYYARNQRTIPPMLYADMVAQSGVGFDGLGVEISFGAPTDGMFVRDMFQISEKLDRLGNFGKPVHITAVQVPSSPIGEGASAGGGCWQKPWDEDIQARWIREFCAIALSKPFVESVTWRGLADNPGQGPLPTGGLLRADLTPKPALKALKEVRDELLETTRKPPGHARADRAVETRDRT